MVDLRGGYGLGVYEHLHSNGVPHGYKGAEGTAARTRDRRFANKRSAAWWATREALDPDQVGGAWLTLPPDSSLLADLAAPRFKTVTVAGQLCVQAEPKEDVVKRLGRSPDRGDAVVMALTQGRADAGWQPPKPQPQVLRGHEAKRRRSQ